MSIHAYKPETEAKIRSQRRSTFITSMIIGILSVVLVMLLLSLVLLAPFFKETPTIVTYESNLAEDTELETRKIPVSVERKPSSPTSSMAKVIAAVTNSPTAVPVPDIEVTVPSVDFGDGNDFGDGWGSGDGFGTGGGGASFFNQKVEADRIAYVIDYSLSMGGERDRLMRKELAKSVSGLRTGMSYQLIFFAGPAWVAGDKVEMEGNRRSATIRSGEKSFDWLGGGPHGWRTKGAKQKAPWIQSGPSTRNESLKLVKESPLIWGTTWEPALEMALAMDPPPQIIFFMTDGVTGGDTVGLAKSIGAKAKAKKITVNTVAMMEPRAEEAMKVLAKRTGGQFTVIEKSGKVRQVAVD